MWIGIKIQNKSNFLSKKSTVYVAMASHKKELLPQTKMLEKGPNVERCFVYLVEYLESMVT